MDRSLNRRGSGTQSDSCLWMVLEAAIDIGKTDLEASLAELDVQIEDLLRKSAAWRDFHRETS